MSTGTAQPLQGEIETPRPLRAPDGQVIVVGWCLVTDLAHPPPVRLRTIAGIVSQTERIERSDVPALLPDQPAAAHCGFILSGRLPAGVYLAEIEAPVVIVILDRSVTDETASEIVVQLRNTRGEPLSVSGDLGWRPPAGIEALAFTVPL